MGDTDEELVRKLHLEINGLARPRRARAALDVSGERYSAVAVLIRCSNNCTECAACSATPVFFKHLQAFTVLPGEL